jgi:hypothetical protein
MPDLVIRRVPKKILDAVRRKAERSGRTLEDEIKIELERIARAEMLPPLDYFEEVRKLREKIARYAPNQSDSTEIIRAHRGPLVPVRRPKGQR